jgi:23S rRNA pseudouridine1911/1915/1917 synthase
MEEKTMEREIICKEGGDRIDVFLRIFLGYSRQFIKKLINEGKVKVNEKEIKPSYILNLGDKISLTIKDEEENNLKLDDILIYEDDDIMVINKPAGLLVHPTDENWIRDVSALEFNKNTLVYIIYRDRGSKLIDVDRMGLVHRLDLETSGIMIVTKNKYSQKFIQNQFAERLISKNYKSLVDGIIEDEELLIDAPIGRFSGRKKLDVMEYGREAQTKIKVIRRGSKNTYIDVFPLTGRTNQIRVHLSFINHPIIGDKIYSKKDFSIDRLMLHSYSIEFIHPSKKKSLKFSVEPDDEFLKILNENI